MTKDQMDQLELDYQVMRDAATRIFKLHSMASSASDLIAARSAAKHIARLPDPFSTPSSFLAILASAIHVAEGMLSQFGAARKLAE